MTDSENEFTEKKAANLSPDDTVLRDGSRLEVVQVITRSSKTDERGESDPNRRVQAQFRDPDDRDGYIEVPYEPDDTVKVLEAP